MVEKGRAYVSYAYLFATLGVMKCSNTVDLIDYATLTTLYICLDY